MRSRGLSSANFGGRFRREVEKTLVNAKVQTRLVVRREAMPDAGREILRNLRLQKHVLFRLPQKRKVSCDRPFRAVVRLQRTFHLQERRLPLAKCSKSIG